MSAKSQSKPLHLLAFDLGAESGRAMLGYCDGRRMQLRELHRFPNRPARLPDGLHWDVLRLWTEIQHGLAMAAKELGPDLAGVGVDTWGVDFALLDQDGALIGNPHHYRDDRTDGMLERAYEQVSREAIFEQTGIQFMQINTLYQLLAMAEAGSPALEGAETLLMMPDLFTYWLTGRRACERTIGSTSQCYDPHRGDWARPLLEEMGIPLSLIHI